MTISVIFAFFDNFSRQSFTDNVVANTQVRELRRNTIARQEYKHRWKKADSVFK